MADLLPLVTLVGEAWADYGLIDSGGGRKLERYGRYRFIRPEPQAMWQPALPQEEWDKADGEFVPAGFNAAPAGRPAGVQRRVDAVDLPDGTASR